MFKFKEKRFKSKEKRLRRIHFNAFMLKVEQKNQHLRHKHQGWIGQDLNHFKKNNKNEKRIKLQIKSEKNQISEKMCKKINKRKVSKKVS